MRQGLHRGAQGAATVVFAVGLAACDFEHGASVRGDGSIDAIDAPDAAPQVPVSCKQMRAAQPTLLSSDYMIDPDGPGGDPPIMVWCDMITDGGGWTVVYLAPGSNLMSTTIGYTSSTQRLLADAQDVLLAFRTSTQLVLRDYATLPMPAAWRTASPFMAAGTDLTTMVSVNGAAPISATLQFGYQNFTSVCGDAWSAGANGRLCIVGTTAPFYSEFANASNDSCASSVNSAGFVACGPDRRFSIAVR